MAFNNLINFKGLAAGSWQAAAAIIHGFKMDRINRHKVSKRAALLMDRAIKSIYRIGKKAAGKRIFVCI